MDWIIFIIIMMNDTSLDSPWNGNVNLSYFDVFPQHLNIDIVRLLLEHGTDPNIWDVTGYTALEWAKYNQDLNLMNLLITYNATQ